VDHEGQKTLTVTVNGNTDLLYSGRIFEAFRAQMNPKFLDIVQPKYSTTTQHISDTCAAMGMDALKAYYAFRMMMMCGLPEVRLGGTAEDWQALKQMCLNLRPLFEKTELNSWLGVHMPMLLDRLIETYELPEGSVAPPSLQHFWSRIVTFIPKGSGGDRDQCGWFAVLVPYSSSKRLSDAITSPEPLNVLSVVPLPEFGRGYDGNDKKEKWFQINGEDRHCGFGMVDIEAGDVFTPKGPLKITVFPGFGPAALLPDGSVCANIGWRFFDTTGEDMTKTEQKPLRNPDGSINLDVLCGQFE